MTMADHNGMTMKRGGSELKYKQPPYQCFNTKALFSKKFNTFAILDYVWKQESGIRQNSKKTQI